MTYLITEHDREYNRIDGVFAILILIPTQLVTTENIKDTKGWNPIAGHYPPPSGLSNVLNIKVNSTKHQDGLRRKITDV